MSATQERLQKPQLILAQSRDNDKEAQCNADNLANLATTMVSSFRSAAGGSQVQTAATEDNKEDKANVEGVGVCLGKETPIISQSRRVDNFEEQLKEIDAAIYGDVAGALNTLHIEHVTGTTSFLRKDSHTSHA